MNQLSSTSEGEVILFAELCEKFLRDPIFTSKLKANDALSTFQQKLEKSRGNVIEVAELLREMMCIDYITSISSWGNLFVDEMVEIQEGVFRDGEAFNSYARYVQLLGGINPNIDRITEEINKIRFKKGLAVAKKQVRDGLVVIQGPWGANIEL